MLGYKVVQKNKLVKYEDETVLVVSQGSLALQLYVEFISCHATGQLASDAVVISHLA